MKFSPGFIFRLIFAWLVLLILASLIFSGVLDKTLRFWGCGLLAFLMVRRKSDRLAVMGVLRPIETQDTSLQTLEELEARKVRVTPK